ncbi:MAG TPA: zinc ribbon domain-containing protein [Acidimicrobiales bacterium]
MAMAFAVAAAVALVISAVLTGIGFVVLNDLGSVDTTQNLRISAAWLGAVAGIAAFIGVASVVWPLVLRRTWVALVEVAGATVATLLIAIGLLVDAADAPNYSLSANVVFAVGLGGWMILLVISGARRSLVEQHAPHGSRQAALWLAASGALLLFAVGVGLQTGSIDNRGLGIATGIILMLGAAALAVTVTAARAQGLITTEQFPMLVAGLWTLAAAYAASAIVAGVVYGPSESLTALRVGTCVVATIRAAAFILLAFAAWGRLRDLVTANWVESMQATTSPQTFPPAPVAACGHLQPVNARFCPECGAPTGSGPAVVS